MSIMSNEKAKALRECVEEAERFIRFAQLALARNLVTNEQVFATREMAAAKRASLDLGWAMARMRRAF